MWPWFCRRGVVETEFRSAGPQGRREFRRAMPIGCLMSCLSTAIGMVPPRHGRIDKWTAVVLLHPTVHMYSVLHTTRRAVRPDGVTELAGSYSRLVRYSRPESCDVCHVVCKPRRREGEW